MGRHSKLTEREWSEIDRRRFAREGTRALAREFGISEGAIRARFSTQHKRVREVAQRLSAAETALRALSPEAQLSCLMLVDKLRSISTSSANAAPFGAAIAHQLALLAQERIKAIDDTKVRAGRSIR